jgi:hypothetical protein
MDWNEYKCVCVDGEKVLALTASKNGWNRIAFDSKSNPIPSYVRVLSTNDGKKYFLNMNKGFTLQFSKAAEKTKILWNDGKVSIDIHENDISFIDLVNIIGTAE